MLTIATIIGARPQFIKASSLSREITKHSDIKEIIIHTGQHFDDNMSAIFFEQMHIPQPDYNLDIHSLSHGAMTGRMLEGIETIILKEKPNWVVVYGDTNSTLAGALAASKLHIKLAHVEAGLRSFDRNMPEEINRIVTDRISDLLFCPTDTAVKNLLAENADSSKIVKTGDIMYDSELYFKLFAQKPMFKIHTPFILSTLHRAENTDDPLRLKSIMNALNKISEKINIVLPLHPRTEEKINQYRLKFSKNVQCIHPVGYLEMLWLLNNCTMVMTDSGGLQKEAYFFEKPCITLRDETEWTELVENKINIVTGYTTESIYNAFLFFSKEKLSFPKELYGKGNAAYQILQSICNA